MKGNKVVKSEQQPSNSETFLNINHAKNDSKQFPSKRALGGHKKVHKAERENHHQENNSNVVSTKGKEVFPSSPTLREHQKSHKREREIHGEENNNNYKKIVTMKGKEVVKSEQHQPSNSVMLIPIIDLTNNGSICGWMKVQEHDIFTSSKTFPCKICNRQFFSAQALGGHGKVHKRKLKHPQEIMENFSIKLEDNVGESSINYHDTIKEEPFEPDLSLKL
ncbi:hypothetical protein TSUD_112850 [Trifolium subterraneum]|uniref:C2H2-type domain-containing protein n=1 Tax=Trifolium subterraneum TaxID=3900 RepID=A0A2Z6LJH7_TRISU|nr:hypothetical protein TSUD_112850 [Trifolium subterraneum]